MGGRDFWRSGELSVLLQKDLEKALSEVDKLSPNLALSEDPTTVIANIVNKIARQPVVPQWQDLKQGKTREVKLSINNFGRTQEINGLAIDIYLPIVGDTTILQYKAHTSSLSPMAWKIDNDKLVLTITKQDLSAEFVKGEYERSRTFLNNAIEWANRDLTENHSAMFGQVNARLNSRREKLERAAKLDDDLSLS